MNNYHFLMKQNFLKKATIHPQYGPEISLETFTQMMIDGQQLITTEDIDENKKKYLCETAFLWAYFVSPKQTKTNNSKNKNITGGGEINPSPIVVPTGRLNQTDGLVFTEFLEAVSKLALTMMESERWYNH